MLHGSPPVPAGLEHQQSFGAVGMQMRNDLNSKRMAHDVNGIQKEPSRQPDYLLSSGCRQIVLTPGTGTPEEFAVPHGAHQVGEAIHTELHLLVNYLEHLK